ncbi:MAG TPA: competence/damage-inducible protein A [Bacteroidales bacterium]|nr:competence/damage-inducible protein A [Bacteroidales bacterium]
MKAIIVNIGDELLIGQVVNTNASWMADLLAAEGIAVERIVAVADRDEAIRQELERSMAGAALVLVTGGLGPTRDDITKATLCRIFNTSLVFNPEAYAMIEAFFASRGLRVSELNRMQAELPQGCLPLPNPQGTAPGMWFEKEGCILVAMPGVPFEMQGIMEHEVVPRLRERMDGQLILQRTILTHGMGESFLAQRLAHWEDTLPGDLGLAYLPSPGQVRLRLTARGTDRSALQAALDEAVHGLQARISELIFGYDRDTMEGVVGALLKHRGQTLCTAESCTGGYLAHRITSVPGSSAWYLGSIIAYANEVKIKQLNVDPLLISTHGAVSEEVVCAMAQGARLRLGTDWALAVSGIAGPDGGSADKPTGTTWIALDGPHGTLAQRFLFGNRRDRNIHMAAMSAMNMMRKQLKGSATK